MQTEAHNLLHVLYI